MAAYFPNPSTGHSFEVDNILIDPNETYSAAGGLVDRNACRVASLESGRPPA